MKDMDITEMLGWLSPKKKLTIDDIKDMFPILKSKPVPLFEMARVDHDYNNSKSVFGINGKYAIYVYGNDGEKLPHFHIVDEATKGKKFDIKIRIKDLSIMSIDDKIKRVKKSESGITWEGYSDLRKHLVAFLNTPYINQKTGVKLKSRYLFIVQHWDDNNPDNQINVSDMLTKIE